MTLLKTIQAAIKSKKTIIGYKRSINFIKSDKPKLIVIVKNIPEEMRKEIEYNAKISGVKVEVFDGTSKELGIICGKPFPVTTLIVKG